MGPKQGRNSPEQGGQCSVYTYYKLPNVHIQINADKPLCKLKIKILLEINI
jgi:hypothetical protein